MNLSRYVAVTERSGGHGGLSWADVESFVVVGAACSLDDLAGDLARDEHQAPDQVRSRILGCNGGATLARLAPGAIVKVNYEKGASSESILDEIPMAGGKYLKFLKWAIGAARAAEHAASRADQEGRWKQIIARGRARIIDRHRILLSALGAPVEENAFERFFNRVIPAFLKSKGVSSSLLAVNASQDGMIVFQFGRTSVFTSDSVDQYG